ncbi:DUF1642 domain-containing protein [Lacticaseibacillus paracasei]|uniref:DUF1642 domain-containing protein n=1 Tax=Lacticaseibacillus paracasei TaxID=1597 RepID=UPI000E5CCEF1|nr:DUF1642 domain-containing protein [Lacticaseibacillus paracasei]MCT3370191.1 DUF1642 domain-containing protein [Lacticaseibacillus paracasei]
MSEEKLYAVKNDEGKYLDCEYEKFLPLSESYCPTMVSEDNAKAIVNDYGGHVVTFVEEPKKVVLSKEDAEIVEGADKSRFPASYIAQHTGNSGRWEKLLMNAYVNGWEVDKPKQYGVWVPHVKGKMYYKDGRGSDDLDIASADFLNDKNQRFTEAEIEHYGLQDCEKEEVTDDDD